MNRIPSDVVDSIIDDLRGTTKTLDQVCGDLGIDVDDLAIADHQHIDEEIFECATCGWWCGMDELSEKHEDENICTDCEDD